MSKNVAIVRMVAGGTFDANVFASAPFAADAREVLALEEGTISTIADKLAASDGFLDRTKLVQLVADVVPDESRAKRVANLIRILDGFFRNSGETLETFQESVERGVKEKATKHFDDDEVERLAVRLRRLVVGPLSLGRQRKAEQLIAETGHELEEVALVCDLRPIFDQARTKIEGMLPISTLRLVVTGDQGLPVAFEARLDEKQVAELRDKAVAALSKLTAMKRLMQEKSIETVLFDVGDDL